MPVLHAIVLGLTQGLSEFLPISSSGHLRLVPWLLGWDDFAGRPDLNQTFDVALHLGTLLGAVVYFRTDLRRLVTAGIVALRPSDLRERRFGTSETSVHLAPTDVEDRPGNADEARLAWLLLASAVPAALIGAVFEARLSTVGERIPLIAALLIAFGLVLLVADRLGGERRADTFSFRDAAVMGAAQAFALVPGVSRSGITITAGRWRRFDRDAAARLSFLMSLPIIAGALAFKGFDVLRSGIPSDFVGAFLWGIAASGVSGFVAVWGTLKLVRTRTFTPFVIYRGVVGAGVLVLSGFGFGS